MGSTNGLAGGTTTTRVAGTWHRGIGTMRRGPLLRVLSTAVCLGLALFAWPAAQAQTVSADALFNWAEQTYGQHFPGHRSTQTQAPYQYRFYPETGNYVGVAGADVYILGPVSKGQLTRVGALQDFTCLVAPASCAPAMDAPTGRLARMAMGQHYTLAVLSSGAVVAWGDNTEGQRTPIPGTVAWQIDGLADVVSVFSTFNGTNLALTRDGRVLGWGTEVNANLGTTPAQQFRKVPTPVQVPGLTRIIDLVPTAIKSSTVTYFALRDDGTVWTAPGDAGSETIEPAKQVPDLPKIVALSEFQENLDLFGADVQQAFGIDELGRVWQLISINGPGLTPRQVPGLSGIVQVSCTNSHCLALDRQGDVWAWGSNSSGQLGDGTKVDREAPAQVAGLTHVRKVVATGHASFALTASAVHAWGYRITSPNLAYLVPTLVLSHADAIVDLYPSFDIPAGSRFMVYRDGHITGNGYNSSGTLGDGTHLRATTDSAPVTVLGINLGGS